MKKKKNENQRNKKPPCLFEKKNMVEILGFKKMCGFFEFFLPLLFFFVFSFNSMIDF